ncbi:MAG: diaminopimelate decarboxylase [Chloroflexota bacterium]
MNTVSGFDYIAISNSRETLHCDAVSLESIAAQYGTPTYIYSLQRILDNYQRVEQAFAGLDAHIHYSAKANANMTILRTLIDVGAGIDVVSGGEIYRALAAGAAAESIVFAGVGKTYDEIDYAVAHGVHWFNVENVAELTHIEGAARHHQCDKIRVALRLNPDVTAQTHPSIATGHGAAKFGLSESVIRDVLSRRGDYPHLEFAGIHVHIGSQLGDISATVTAVKRALSIIEPFPDVTTINIGGGLPVAYGTHADLPQPEDFATALRPLLSGYTLLLEPGRFIVADAGALLTTVLYIKEQGGQHMVIVDASMTELLRPALYHAYHPMLPLNRPTHDLRKTQVVGPVCETTDVLGRDVELPRLEPGDHLLITHAGAYGAVMASNYNARLHPLEIAVGASGEVQVIRKRDTWADLIRSESFNQ